MFFNRRTFTIMGGSVIQQPSEARRFSKFHARIGCSGN